MVNVIVALILVLIVGAAILYIRREKKKGAKCVGCPYAASCAAKKAEGGCQNGENA